MRIALLLSVAFLLSFLVLFTSSQRAWAETSNSALWCPNLFLDTVKTGDTVELGALYISEKNAGSIKENDWVTISLPSWVKLKSIRIYFPPTYLPYSVSGATYKVEFDENGFTVNREVYSYGDWAGLGPDMLLQAVSPSSFTLKVNKNWIPTKTCFKATIYFDQVLLQPQAAEEFKPLDIKATLDAPSRSGFSSGSVTVAKLQLSARSSISADLPTQITESGGSLADITLKEDAPGALRVNGEDFLTRNTVKLTLSPGFVWDQVKLIPQGGVRLR
ncbi:hypothetical protein [Ammonifex thiophilus]|uniref:hypothetical protein n=1 Tax=Ammonifex thiophilus TaxID=444093 RepID=UPI00196B783E|nr:hypothetical protein [Ammonifex thiophilus]